MRALSSYRAAGDVHRQGTAEPLQVVYDLQLPDRFLLSFKGTREGQPFEVAVAIVGTDLYLNPPDSTDWFHVPLELRARLPFPVLDVGQIFRQFVTGLGDPVYVDRAELDGVATYRVRGTLPPGTWTLFHPGEKVPSPEPTGTAEAWVGVDDFLVYRLDLTLGGDSTTLRVSEINRVTVSAPPNPRPAEELRTLIAPSPERRSPYGLPTTPGEVKALIESLPASIRECGRKAVGEAAFEELAAGARLPTSDEIQKVLSCSGY